MDLHALSAITVLPVPQPRLVSAAQLVSSSVLVLVSNALQFILTAPAVLTLPTVSNAILLSSSMESTVLSVKLVVFPATVLIV